MAISNVRVLYLWCLHGYKKLVNYMYSIHTCFFTISKKKIYDQNTKQVVREDSKITTNCSLVFHGKKCLT